MPLKFNIENTNFDYFFLEQSAGMSETQKERLPRELLYKVFVKGFRVNSKSVNKLSFMAKLYILVRSLNKRWIVMVEDDEKGMNEEEFFKWKDLTKRRNYTSDSATDLISEGEFVLGSSELFDTFHKLNSLSVSPAYNYIQKIKNRETLMPDEYVRNMRGLINWVNNYEAMRKKLVMESGITMAEWITLTYLYDGKEKTGRVLYTEKFRYSYNTSATKIKLSFGTLQNKGLITKYGNGQGCKLQITALGKDKVSSVTSKYLVNC